MAALPKLISYREFASRCKTRSRFIRDAESEHFLGVLADTVGQRRTAWPKDKPLHRARLGCARFVQSRPQNEDGDTFDEAVPYGPDCMKPLPLEGREGRANPKGIPALYLATDDQTAVSEIRPHLLALISVAIFYPTRDLNLADCSRDHSLGPIALAFREANGPSPATIWTALDRAFAEPIHESETSADYAPTQVVAETLKTLGFDGLMFKSSVGNGMNVVLFDPTLAVPIEGHVVEVDAIEYRMSRYPASQSWKIDA